MSEPRRGPNPLLYFILYLPYGAGSGFVTVALGYIATQRGVPVEEFAGLAAMHLLPATFKFTWAPITDAIWTRKAWYVSANLLSSATLLTMGLSPMAPGQLGLIGALIFMQSVAGSFMAMAAEAFMAHASPPAERGRAAGWSQAGNLAGGGVGGGLALFLAENLSPLWLAPAIFSGSLLLCTFALVPLPEPLREGGRLWARFKDIGRDVWGVLRSRAGVLAVALCFLPIGSGAASGLFSAMATDWQASASLVSWMNGGFSGVVMAVGCLAGGQMSDAIGRKTAYVVAGLALAAVALGMGLAPRAPWSYGVFCIAYSLAVGLAYGAFTGLVLEVIGAGAAATKYNVFASLSNFPIWYMTRIDGWAAGELGPSKMLFVDAASGVIGVVLFLAVVAALTAVWKRRDAR